MATNVELEKQIVALKAEVAALKIGSAESVKAELDALKLALGKIFTYRFFEQPETSNEWDRLTTVEVSAKVSAAVIHETPAAPKPAADRNSFVQSALKQTEENSR
jgi:hypothetical protein